RRNRGRQSWGRTALQIGPLPQPIANRSRLPLRASDPAPSRWLPPLRPSPSRGPPRSCLLPPKLGDDATNLLAVVERQHPVSYDLPLLMSLARYHQDVTLLQVADGLLDGHATTVDLDSLRDGGQNLRPDVDRHLAARTVVGDDQNVRQSRGNLPHQGPLARVSIPASAEDNEQPAPRMGT